MIRFFYCDIWDLRSSEGDGNAAKRWFGLVARALTLLLPQRKGEYVDIREELGNPDAPVAKGTPVTFVTSARFPAPASFIQLLLLHVSFCSFKLNTGLHTNQTQCPRWRPFWISESWVGMKKKERVKVKEEATNA